MREYSKELVKRLKTFFVYIWGAFLSIVFTTKVFAEVINVDIPIDTVAEYGVKPEYEEPVHTIFEAILSPIVWLPIVIWIAVVGAVIYTIRSLNKRRKKSTAEQSNSIDNKDISGEG